MIEIAARLSRGSVYFAGEELECWITLRNISPLENSAPSSPLDPIKEMETSLTGVKLNGDHKDDTSMTSVAFVSCQIHCQCSVEDSKVVIPVKPLIVDRSETLSKRASTAGLPEQSSFCLISSIPKLLVGNLSMRPGEEFNMLYSEIIPKSSSPSFRGLAVRYSWKLALGCQILGQQTTVIHIPLWILVIKDLDNLMRNQVTEEHVDDINANGDAGEIAVLNGNGKKQNGTETPDKRPLLIDTAMQILDDLTIRRTLRTYSIESPSGKLGKLCLNKTRFRLGEDILGKFDFTERSITCVQYLVSLISEEQISPENRRSKIYSFSENIVSKVHDFCLCLQQTNFILPVPLHITPSFSSEIVDLRWKLRFEFALSSEVLQLDVPPVGNDQQSVLWRPPLRVPVETFIWDIPVEIYPTDPIQVHSVHLRDSLGSDVRVKL